MTRPVIVDTSPLVAALNSRDPHHQWAAGQWKALAPPVLTCEAVVAEACHLARRTRRGNPEHVLDLVGRGILDVSFSLVDEVDRVRALAEKYRDVPMSLADACLVRMSELHPGSVVFTLDCDFAVYRRHRRQAIPLLAPDASGPSRSGE